jgi:uncharacterized protein
VNIFSLCLYEGVQMDKVPDIIKDKLNKFLGILEENKIEIERAILFGSYAKGNFNKWSDIDLALISNNFIGDRFQDKMNLVNYIKLVDWDISPYPFRPEDFEDSMFARDEILKYGIVIK